MTYDARYEKLFSDYAKQTDFPWGVTEETLAAYRRCPVDQVNLTDLTEDEARRVHHTLVWQWQGLYRMPVLVSTYLFPKLIATGDATPIKELQAAMGCNETGVIDADFARRVKGCDFASVLKKLVAPAPVKKAKRKDRSNEPVHQSQSSQSLQDD